MHRWKILYFYSRAMHPSQPSPKIEGWNWWSLVNARGLKYLTNATLEGTFTHNEIQPDFSLKSISPLFSQLLFSIMLMVMGWITVRMGSSPIMGWIMDQYFWVKYRTEFHYVWTLLKYQLVLIGQKRRSSQLWLSEMYSSVTQSRKTSIHTMHYSTFQAIQKLTK